jgi:RNA polymerase sigma-70 factor, ECF subfamily
VPEFDEQKMLGALLARDEHAFSLLVLAYERRVLSLVIRMLGHREEARELTQEVFIQVFKSLDSFRGEAKLSTWIYRVAINMCKNRTKYLRVRHTDAQEDFADVAERVSMNEAQRSTVSHVERPDEAVAGRQIERIVQAGIAELEDSFRECLVLRDVEELSYEEVSQITGLPLGTVKSRIHRARILLREYVEARLGERLG